MKNLIKKHKETKEVYLSTERELIDEIYEKLKKEREFETSYIEPKNAIFSIKKNKSSLKTFKTFIEFKEDKILIYKEIYYYHAQYTKKIVSTENIETEIDEMIRFMKEEKFNTGKKQNATQVIVDLATKIALKDVLPPKCVRDGTVKKEDS